VGGIGAFDSATGVIASTSTTAPVRMLVCLLLHRGGRRVRAPTLGELERSTQAVLARPMHRAGILHESARPDVRLI